MNDVTLSAISLFSGVGMLDEGLRAGLRFMGFSHRTVLHVEREAHGASVLAARMEEGSLDAAPIWSDVTTLDAVAWHGRVDIVVAGFPCQDLSVAGRRVGLDGKRSGLFFEVVRIAADCGARFMFLENVAGIASATASVMDEASASDYAAKPAGDGFSDVGVEDGRLLERAAARVVGELADLGWDSEWITLSASDVGASHGRARWFCLAWRMDDSQRAERRPKAAGIAGCQQGHDGGGREEVGRVGIAVEVLADAARDVGDGIGDGEGWGGRGVRQAGHELGDAAGDGRGEGRSELPRRAGRPDSGGAGLSMADAGCSVARRLEHITGPGGESAEYFIGSENLAYAGGAGLQRAWRTGGGY